MDKAIIPVILSGGTGSRLWPVSQLKTPKQFLSLTSKNSLLQHTIQLLENCNLLWGPIISCNKNHRFIAAEQIRNSASLPEKIILEPMSRNTAPAVANAALYVKKNISPSAMVLVMPSDHFIGNAEIFYQNLETAAIAAEKGYICSFGIKPGFPETGFGYINHNMKEVAQDCYKVESFREKPDLKTAEKLIKNGSLWNSGILLAKAETILREMKKYCPEVLKHCMQAYENSRDDVDFLWLEEDDFAKAPFISIDYALMEKTKKAVVIEAGFEWRDIGSWEAIFNSQSKDNNSNVCIGNVYAESTDNSYLHSDGMAIGVIGLENVVVVATKTGVLVSHKNHTQDTKKIVERMQMDALAEG